MIDGEGRPLADARVTVFNRSQTRMVGTTGTSSTGLATIDSVPAVAIVSVLHEFGEYYRVENLRVAQQGGSFLSVTLQARRPSPTVALLPVSIPAGSVNADRNELTLQVTVVASAAAPFELAGYGDYSAASTPSLGLAIEQDEWGTQRQCSVWTDLKRLVPDCGAPLGQSPYTVRVERFGYDRSGSIPTLAADVPAESALLLMDQSQRVLELDPGARRSFAARQFLARAATSAVPRSLSVAGFAANGNGLTAALPELPLWVPLGAGTSFSSDRPVLTGAVGTLEPLLGGSAPVFAALQAALSVTAAEAPPGNRALVALLGGADDREISEAARHAALASLRRQRDEAAIQTVLIAGARLDQAEQRLALADLAAALRAPVVSLGVPQTWESGSYAALDLAADLLDGVPLPTLSAVFRVQANQPQAFPAGTMLHGVLYVESATCSFGCWEVPLEFAVEVP